MGLNILWQAQVWGRAILLLGLLLPALQAGEPAAARGRPTGADAGEKAWQELVQSLPDSKPPAEWQTQQPSPEQVAQFEKHTAEQAAAVLVRVRAFQKDHPAHERAAQAKQVEYQLLNLVAQLGDSSRKAELEAFEEARLKEPGISADDRFEIRMRQSMRPFMRPSEPGNRQAALVELEKSARSLQKEFPARSEVHEILMLLAQSYIENDDFEKARALAEEIAAGAPGEARNNAAALARRLDRIGKPLRLKCATIDGKEIDTQRLEGKVVLVDFWATWCPPCRTMLPELKSVYKKYRSKGFEIVGVSFDQNQLALRKYLSDQGVTWPQYCDGRGWENRLAREFDVTAIPAMWLVDKRGNLRHINAREKLAAKVEQLLAEK